MNFLNFVKRPLAVEGEAAEEPLGMALLRGGDVCGERETFEGTREGGCERSIGSIIARLLISIPRFKNFATR